MATLWECAPWYTCFEVKGSGWGYCVAPWLQRLANPVISTDSIYGEYRPACRRAGRHEMKMQTSRAPGQWTMVVMCLLLTACAAPTGPSVSSTGGYSVEVSEGR